jgi:hypothetical protein
LRYIEYENTASGLKELAIHLTQYFLWMEKNPQKPDNQFIELAGFVKFQYPKFVDFEEQQRKKQQALVALMTPFLQSPELIKIILDPNVDENTKNAKLLDWFKNDPEALIRLLDLFNNPKDAKMTTWEGNKRQQMPGRFFSSGCMG